MNPSLKGMYLKENLLDLAKNGKPFVYANYITDLNDTIAKKDKDGMLQLPPEIGNDDDWDLFNELQAQADIIITSGQAIRSLKNKETYMQYEIGEKYEKLGDWRIKNGFKTRSPDIAIVSRSLDFNIPPGKVIVFTSDETAKSEAAANLRESGTVIVPSTDGKLMIDFLNRFKYRTIEMVTGPSVFKILLDANVLDRIYITQVQKTIPFKDPSEIRRVIENKKINELPNFKLSRKVMQENVKPHDGSITKQVFLVYDKTIPDLKP